MQRVIARAHDRPSAQKRLWLFVTQMLVLAATAFGAWWTVEAVADGRPWAMLFRFTLSIVLGVYYLMLARIVRVRFR